LACKPLIGAEPVGTEAVGPKVRRLFADLLAHYGPQHWWPAETPFEVIVGAVLTQATAWRNVEQAVSRLKQAGLLDPERLAHIEPAVLAGIIRPAGYPQVKASRLRALVGAIRRDFGSVEVCLRFEPARLRAWLLSVPGIGPETADSILLYAAGRPYFPVDAYTRRLFLRYGVLSAPRPYEEIRRLVEEALGPDPAVLGEFHALIVAHGKAVCRKRPRCGACPVRADCRFWAEGVGFEPTMGLSTP
jgi:endonuclease-3 related protein